MPTESSSRTLSPPPTSAGHGAFYAGVLGGEVLRDGEPSIVAVANGWIIINAGGPAGRPGHQALPDARASGIRGRVTGLAAACWALREARWYKAFASSGRQGC